MVKLNFFIDRDPRIKRVYDYSKKKYNEANMPQHNWEHVIRDLYRALVIAEDEKEINYSILIPAVILHDIGVSEEVYKKHAEKGAEIVKRDLPKFGFDSEEIDQIAKCVLSHRGTPKPQSKEAQILFDADHLEKSGIGGIFATYRAQLEINKPLIEFIHPRNYKNSDLFTKKAKEISGNGFQERDEHFISVAKSLKKRKDWIVAEEDLWEQAKS